MNRLKSISITGWIFLGLFSGALTGALLGDCPAVAGTAGFFSDIFLRLLKMIIVPLIVTSIVSGVVGIGDPERIGKLGFRTVGYYGMTSFLAVLTGLLVVNLIRPGVGTDLALQADIQKVGAASGSLIDIFKRMVPLNLFDVMAKGEILPVIFFCILFGVLVTRLPQAQREQLSGLFQGAFGVMMKMTHFVMWFAPIGVWGILTEIVATTGFAAFKPLLLYAFCVLLGLLIHAGISLPMILRLFARKSAVRLFKAQSPALLTAFSTASSSATLPLSIDCIESRAGVSNKVSSFVLPLGATVNMDGTALYECVAAMFIAQAYGIDLSFSQQLTVVITALLASIGAAGIPMAGLVMMSVILNAVGLPLEGVGLILAVDRPLDMCRTVVNIWSDHCGAATIAVLEGETDILQKDAF